MTTVIATRIGMAADTMITCGDVFFESSKIFTAKNGDLIGIAGNVVEALSFVRWYDSDRNSPPDIEEPDDIEILVISSEGMTKWNGKGIPMRVNSPVIAIGTGQQAALAAYECGMELHECIEIASKIDVSTGGSVEQRRYVPLAPLKTVRQRKPKKD